MRDLSAFPQPLLDDLVRGRWLPVIGAGFSRNAVVSDGKQMPLWEDLGRAIAKELRDYPYSTPLDAISAFAHEFCRPRLVERLSELLFVTDSQPGSAHHAFCSLPLDLVCTTNLEFLLERQYAMLARHCRPVMEADQIAVNRPRTSVTLLKLHGDLHNPDRLVVTEADYDGFLDRYPVFATYLSSLLITRTPVFVGYSLDDPDFRQLWQVLEDRLGRARRDAYALLVAPHQFEIAKYERRGVKVIAIPDAGGGYGATLTRVFRALSNHLKKNVLNLDDVGEEEARRELALPIDSTSRICFFSVPHDLHSFYRTHVFPVAETYGLVPITVENIVGSGDNLVATIEALINRSHAVVVDAANQFTLQELAVARAAGKGRRTLAILPSGQAISAATRGLKRIQRPKNVTADSTSFLSDLRDWFTEIGAKVATKLPGEPSRLLEKGEFRAAVIAAMTLLETAVRRALASRDKIPLELRSLRGVLRHGVISELLDAESADRVDQWRRIRNRAVHTMDPVEHGTAEEVVYGVGEMMQRLERSE